MLSDPITVAFIGGFISCLMTVFPVAMLMLIPHDGWGTYLPSNHTKKLQNEIAALKKQLDQIEGKAILESKV